MKSTYYRRKAILSFIIFLFLCWTAKSEFKSCWDIVGNVKRLTKLHYENSSGERGITIFEYDNDGIAQIATWKLLDGTRYSHNYLTYDKSGNLVRKYREFSDGIISWNNYEYDDKNNLVKETFQRSDSVTGQTFYHYDLAGKLEKADCQGLNGWFYGNIEYQYSGEKKVSALISSKGEKTGTITYTHTESGYLLSETWEFQNGWSQQFIYEYEDVNLTDPPSFTSTNVFIGNTAEFIVSKEEYDFNGETGGPSFYEYGEDGCLIKKVFERSDTFRTETTYEYESNGILKHSFRTYSNGLTAEFSYEFDGNRRLIYRSYIRSDGVTGSERYSYNEKGSLEAGIYDNFDSWLTGTIRFEHDENGLINDGHFTSKDGYTAEISFGYDTYGNIIRIHWEFSFGKTQTYDFEYKKIDQRYED